LTAAAGRWTEIAPAKLNLALHVRGRLEDGRHAIETLFAFCTDGDRLSGVEAEEISLSASGPFAAELGEADDNLVIRAAQALREHSGTRGGARLHLIKNLPVASGIGGGSADAAAALRLLTAMWTIDPAHASAVASSLGADVPACLLSMTARGSGAGDLVELVEAPGIAGRPVLLVNPRVQISTPQVFAAWDGVDRGPLGDWRLGRNDLEAAAVELAPQIGLVLAWLSAQPGAELVRMSGSGATCFAIFATEEQRDLADEAVPREWWRLATHLR
jgi:4-diphosphocytidyl-2-C-methyl-D-erythritol kinase